MPLYEWMCQNCGKIEEILHGYGRDVDGPICCGKVMERKVSVVNHTFGWRFSEASHLPGHKDELVRRI